MFMSFQKITQTLRNISFNDIYFNLVTLLLNTTNTNNAQNNTFVDSSTYALSVTRAGTATQGSFSPFALNGAYNTTTNAGSAYFAGTSGNYISFTKPGLATIFTYEFWVYPIAIAGGQNMVISQTATAAGFPIIGNNGSAITVAQQGSNIFTCSQNPTVGAWNHIALVREGTGTNQLKLYLNGINIGQATYATVVDAQTSSIGGGPSATGINAYFASARLVNGTAVYTSNFTPPTAPLGLTTGGQNPPTGTQTQFLFNFTNAGIYDAAAKNDFLTVGNAAVSTAQAKFGNTSVAFDGVGDYVSAANVVITNAIQNANCTIEMWVNSSNSSSALKCLIDTRSAQGTNTGYGIYQNANNVVIYGNGVKGNAVASLAGNTWTHLAVTRSGSNNYVFLSGTLFNTFSYGNTLTSGNVIIGSDIAGSNAFTGYIEEVRITNGVARYTQNFTPPNFAFPVQ